MNNIIKLKETKLRKEANVLSKTFWGLIFKRLDKLEQDIMEIVLKAEDPALKELLNEAFVRFSGIKGRRGIKNIKLHRKAEHLDVADNYDIETHDLMCEFHELFVLFCKIPEKIEENCSNYDFETWELDLIKQAKERIWKEVAIAEALEKPLRVISSFVSSDVAFNVDCFQRFINVTRRLNEVIHLDYAYIPFKEITKMALINVVEKKIYVMYECELEYSDFEYCDFYLGRYGVPYTPMPN